LWSASVTALVAGIGVCALQYVALYSARVDVATGRPDPAGVQGAGTMMVAMLALLFGSAVLAMLWFFSVGSATRRDLHAIFEGVSVDQSEPWMIEEVTARIALSPEQTTVPDSAAAAVVRRPPGPRPTPGIFPAWRSMPVWGALESAERGRSELRRRRGETVRN